MIFLIKKVLNFKIFWKNPSQKKVLVYDRASLEFAKILFKASDFSLYDTRYESVNAYILIKSIIKNGLNNIKKNYKYEYFKSVNPKIIYTCIDYNIGFFRLKNLYPNATYIADQCGIRDNVFFLNCKKYIKETKNDLTVDYFFCFGKNDENKIKKIIKGEILVLGSTINNEFNKFNMKNKKIKKLIFISSSAVHAVKLDDMIFRNLIRYKLKKNLKLIYLDKPQGHITKDLSPNLRKNQFLKQYGKDFIYYSGKKFNDSYKLLNDDAAIIFAGSTLGYEAFSSGNRCVSFNHQKYHYDYRYPKSGPFWSQLKNFQSVKSLIDKVIKYNETEWNKIYFKYSKNIIFFDKKNYKKKKLINNLLGS